MTLYLINLTLLIINLACSGFLISKILYQYGFYVTMSAKLLGGYRQVFKVTFNYFLNAVRKLTQQRLKVPVWSIADNLRELTFTCCGQPCKVLLQINTKVPTKVTCSDGLDVTQDALPYLRVTPVKFTPEVYGEPLQVTF